MQATNTAALLCKTIDFVKEKLRDAEGGHDWFHVERVWKMAHRLAKETPCNTLVVHLSALLHDIADAKFHNGDETIGPKMAKQFLAAQQLEQSIIDQVVFIIENCSFKNREALKTELPIELQIVQDADRLDALGAIGIARTFNFNGFKGNPMYDPEQPPKMHQSKEEYKQAKGTAINHFYEKLLLLKDMMHTPAAQKIAAQRHEFMLEFLEQFYKEWNAEL